MARFCLVLPMLLVLWASEGQAAFLSFNTGGTSEIRSTARDGRRSLVEDAVVPSRLPSSGSTFATEGNSTSETEFSLSSGGFAFAFDHYRASDFMSIAGSSGEIYFSVSSDAQYRVEGLYRRLGEGSSAHGISASLREVGNSASLFTVGYNNRGSIEAVDLVFGEPASATVLVAMGGALEGDLIAGRLYVMGFSAGVSFDDYNPQGGEGSLNFAIIPEPGTAMLLGVGLLALSISGRE